MNGHRQAAAVLHGLAEHDRSLILAELPGADQTILICYLDELQQLGFEAGPAIAIAGGASAQSQLALAPLQAMQAVLQNEPASLVGQVLALGPWPWSEELLAQMPAGRREQVSAVASAGQPAPARARFLVEELAARMADQSPKNSPRQPTAWWYGAIGKVRAWTR